MNSNLPTGVMIVSLIAMVGWLILNLRALRSHELGREKTVRYALAWVAIFGVVAFIATRMAG